MKAGRLDPRALVEAVHGKKRTEPADPEEMFERELARMLVREVGKSLEDSVLSSEMSGVQSLLEEELVDRLVSDGLFRDLSAHGPPAPPRSGTSLPVHGRVTSTYGMRSDPMHGRRRMHRGIDLSAPTGAPVAAARSGTVRFAGERGGYGNLVIVDHGAGLETWYAHLSAIDVRPGSRIAARQQLGKVGQTGRATGPHLHLEVRRNGRAIDPERIFGSIHPKGHGPSGR